MDVNYLAFPAQYMIITIIIRKVSSLTVSEVGFELASRDGRAVRCRKKMGGRRAFQAVAMP